MSRNDIIADMVFEYCSSISRSPDRQPDSSLEFAKAEEIGCTAIAAIIRDVARLLMWSAEEELTPDDYQVHLRSTAVLHAREAESICESQLLPIVGASRAEAIRLMSHSCAMHIQNRMLENFTQAEADKLWMEYYKRRMGFDDPDPPSGNRVVQSVCYHRCRYLFALYRQEEARPFESAADEDDTTLYPALAAYEAAYKIAELEAKEAVSAPPVIDVIVAMTERIMKSVHLERDSAIPIKLVNSIIADIQTQSQVALCEARSILKEELEPAVGDTANVVWDMCHNCAWYVQNTQQSYTMDAECDRLWMEHYTRRMGFAEPPMQSGNRLMASLMYHQCRYWTAAQDMDETTCKSRSEFRPREAAFRIAEIEAKECICPAVVDICMNITRELRRYVNLERLADRKHPMKVVNNVIRGIYSQAAEAKVAARILLEEHLQPLLGERAEAVWQVSFNCAWLEQNLRDADACGDKGTTRGRLIASRVGYLKDAQEDKIRMEQYVSEMGFDDCMSPKGSP